MEVTAQLVNTSLRLSPETNSLASDQGKTVSTARLGGELMGHTLSH